MFGPEDISIKLQKFTISNAMALSVNLGTWEATLDQYIESMEAVTEVNRSLLYPFLSNCKKSNC